MCRNRKKSVSGGVSAGAGFFCLLVKQQHTHSFPLTYFLPLSALSALDKQYKHVHDVLDISDVFARFWSYAQIEKTHNIYFIIIILLLFYWLF